MNWFKAFNDALEYIEEHINEPLNSETIAKVALCSKYHFLRTFTMLSNITLGEYIRHRRLSLAAKDLILTNQKIHHIAYKYGYESPEAFCKAFKRLHGITPSEARKKKAALKAIPPLYFQISIKGEKRMDYKILTKDTFQLVGLSRAVTTKNQQNYTIVPNFWKDVCQNGALQKMKATTDTTYGVCYDYNSEQEEFRYLIGIEGQPIDKLKNYEVLDIPAATWAIFDSVGPMPHTIQNIWKRIFSEWFPATQYEHANNVPELEVYLPGDPQSENYRCEIWIPIVEK